MERVLSTAGHGPALRRLQAEADEIQNALRRLLPTGLTLLFTEGHAGGTNTHAITAYGNVGLVNDAWIARVGPSVLPPVQLVAHYNMTALTGLAWNASSFQWQGKHWILFGEGDATSLSPVMVRDAVAHEYGHTVYRVRYPLLSGGTTESAALGEAYADFLTGMVDVHEHAGNASTSTYQISPVFTDATKFLRSWKKPQDANAFRKGFDWYPRAFRGSGYFDQNSTIIGHWFYLLARGGRNASYGVAADIPDISVIGQGCGTAQLVLHGALTSGALVGNPTFLDLRAATEDAASLLSPPISANNKAAWDAVGVRWNCTKPPAKPNLILHDRCAGRWRLTWASVPGATTYFGQAVPEGWPWSLSTPIIEGNLNQCS